ncbi:NAD-dependent epimerase/dehydratase family protein [Candidatus Beckwithbacteria bacterium]|nr:NAD-dependent epimerase/dehydratase family protein [Candidatus Beckwithbacteria bacterium]
MKKILITGSGGLIGSETVSFFSEKGFEVYGIDNDMRSYFFGDESSTKWKVNELKSKFLNYHHYSVDIRDEGKIKELFVNNKFDIIIHTAAQPSHDWAAREPFVDFSINAQATLSLLELFKKFCPEAVFIFTSTNKVYGDNPNLLSYEEHDTRYELPSNHKYFNGIDESMSIDQCKHSLFGVSKLTADILVQEYGRYFNLNTGVFRGGCLTGPNHCGAQLHGFLSYLVKAIYSEKEYTILGYKGKQVRDNIHAYDLVNAFYSFYQNPKRGEVYNMGGSRHSNISIIEAVKKIEQISGKKAKIKIENNPRSGDHIWYISDVSKFQKHYPAWNYKYNINDILEQICIKEYKK